MGVATQAQAVRSGILGISFDTDESIAADGGKIYVNFIDAMVKQGHIATRSYSLNLNSLDSDKGTILFSAYDNSRCVDDLVLLDIQPNASGKYSEFSVIWSSLTLTYDGYSTAVDNPDDFPLPAILDSGTSLTLIPPALFEELASYYGVVNSSDYGYLIDCSAVSAADTLDFEFGGANGIVINVPMSEMALPQNDANGYPLTIDDDHTPACTFGLYPSFPGSPILLGDTFLRSAYVVYDLDALQIGICNADWSDTRDSDYVTTATGGPQAPGAADKTISGSVLSASTAPRSSITGATTTLTDIVNHNATETGSGGHPGSTSASGSGAAATTSHSGASTVAQYPGLSTNKIATYLSISLVTGVLVVGLLL
ncbi:hypothetical protein LTR86_004634 [Recurvomyces mirabilis]|nr:hypothetical protein LTR86_004634 [Recurvomyces mirabilis]